MIRFLRPALVVAVLFVLMAVPPVQAGGETSGIRLEVPNDNFRFGPVPEGAVVHHDFILKNNGTTPVAILNVRTG